MPVQSDVPLEHPKRPGGSIGTSIVDDENLVVVRVEGLVED